MFLSSRISATLNPNKILILCPWSDVDNIPEKLITWPKLCSSEKKNESLNHEYLAPSTHIFILTLPCHSPVVPGPVLWLGSTRIHLSVFTRQPAFLPKQGDQRKSSGQDTQVIFLPSLYAYLWGNLGYYLCLEGFSCKSSRNLRKFSVLRTVLLFTDCPSNCNTKFCPNPVL